METHTRRTSSNERKPRQAAFAKYQEIGQAKYLNSHFTLSDFKGIYFWEWLHRNWGRLIGVVFFIPFIYFIVKKKIDKSMIVPMIILFLLGGLRGAIGWIMVQSGLNDEDLYVSHIRLAIHFIAALSLLWYTLSGLLKLSIPQKHIVSAPSLRKLSGWILGLLTLQLVYGAFMAGLHAALSANTWPTINGMWWPMGMFTQGGFLEDITHNPITIQFIHRGLAYLLTILIASIVVFLRQPAFPSLYACRSCSCIVGSALTGFTGCAHRFEQPGEDPLSLRWLFISSREWHCSWCWSGQGL